jgi:hypothetical protein
MKCRFINWISNSAIIILRSDIICTRSPLSFLFKCLNIRKTLALILLSAKLGLLSSRSKAVFLTTKFNICICRISSFRKHYRVWRIHISSCLTKSTTSTWYFLTTCSTLGTLWKYYSSTYLCLLMAFDTPWISLKVRILYRCLSNLIDSSGWISFWVYCVIMNKITSS